MLLKHNLKPIRKINPVEIKNIKTYKQNQERELGKRSIIDKIVFSPVMKNNDCKLIY